MYVVLMIALSSLCLCTIFVGNFISNRKNSKKHKFHIKIILSTILSAILLIFSTTWLTSIWLYSKPLTYEQLQKYKVVVPPRTMMTVPMPENIEDTILMFFHRDQYIKEKGKRLEKLKEADIMKKWNYKERKEDVTLFNTSWESKLPSTEANG